MSESANTVANRTTPLRTVVKLGWAFGQLPIATHVGVVSFYLLYFVTEVRHVPPAWAGIALLLPRLFNIVFDPFMGGISDRTRTRAGRRRPYLLGGSIVWGVAIALLFGMPVSGDVITGAIELFMAYLVVSMGQTLYHVPYSAMMAEMAQNSNERISLAAWKESVSRVGILIAASALPFLVGLYPTQVLGYRSAGVVFGAIMIVGGVVAFFATRRAPASTATQEHISFTRQISTMLHNRPFCTILLAYVLIMVADEIFSEGLVYYAVNVLGQTPAFVGKAYPISSIAATLVIPLWNLFARRSGKRTALMVAIIGMAASWSSVVLVPASAPWMMLVLMGIGGAFNAGLLLLPNAMVPDTVEYDAQRTNQRREGALYGAWIFCQQTAMACGGFIFSMSLALIGYHAGSAVQAPHVHTDLTLLVSVLPGVLVLTALICVKRYSLGDMPRQNSAGSQVLTL